MSDLSSSFLVSPSTAYPIWKRPLDLSLAFIGLTMIWPLFAVIALAVKFSSRGPIFFVQQRVGLNGESFGMIKFRSMYADAEERRAELLALSDRSGICFKSRRDPRITPIGRILRRLSLDELPQIINVIKGEMSLVGPRPALPEEVSMYPPHALGRLLVLPGITGFWQVSGRAEIGFEEMIDMDLSYANDGRFLTDVTLLLRTFGAVIGGKGAY